MTETNERLARVEAKLDAVILRVDGRMTDHEVKIVKLQMQVKAALAVMGLVLLGGGGAAGLLKIIGG